MARASTNANTNASNAPAADADAATAAQAVGQRLGRAAGPGHLYPGGGKIAVKTEEAVFCGRIIGETFAYREHPNSKDPGKTSIAFEGRFLLIDHLGKQTVHTSCYLPGVFGNGLRAQLSRPNADMVSFAVEIWAEPDEITGRKSAIGYEYAVYDRTPRRGQQDPLLILAADAGIIDLPALPAPDARRLSADDVDPETGEILTPAERAAAAAQARGGNPAQPGK